jgi:transposase
MLLTENARPHTAARTRAMLEHFNWELFEHPPHSPGLVPNFYHLYIYLKDWLGSQSFNNNEELTEAAKTRLRITCIIHNIFYFDL